VIFWHRFYDPETGRYISADPIGIYGGINLYAYIQNDPINAVDPYGLLSQTPSFPMPGSDPHPFPPEWPPLSPENPPGNGPELPKPPGKDDFYGLFSTCPDGKCRKFDHYGFANCMRGEQVIAACGMCVGMTVSGVGSGVGIAICSSCAALTLDCKLKNSKCVPCCYEE
jgi:hypothetical protein